MAEGLMAVAALPDPVGRWLRCTGVPTASRWVGCVCPWEWSGSFTARPNVTADAAGLCLKTGNAIILRGGSEAFNSNRAIAGILARAAADAGIHEGPFNWWIPLTARRPTYS